MEWFNVGTIVNTHGVRGEVRVKSVSDFEEERFQPGQEIYVENNEAETGYEPLVIKSSRPHKQFILLTFEGYNSIDDVDWMKNAALSVPETALAPLKEEEFYFHEIIDADVYTEEGSHLGYVKEILTPGANDVWVVEPAEGRQDILLPYIEEVVQHVDVAKKRITVRIMKGMLPE
ncbi:ribosome maturation factor RimM [Marinococcus halophilus]|uniref:Ribosome maturation factor RimM n=1 Tax=Marinococcus halophilus TaxID=1371 RepID=A0A510Y229_MARHA|nr:ribosome maturation factor RimM [Marinococcus halophilus]OZT81415.1 ribosome maturation factor RimM [Marinococcus halophilus]GEK57370.1 ribosome maturation factor RimM [Marinococcus halophilus]